MPEKLMQCVVKGAKGWKSGPEGTCYTGDGGRAQAVKQGQAININQGRKAGKAWAKKLPAPK